MAALVVSLGLAGCAKPACVETHGRSAATLSFDWGADPRELHDHFNATGWGPSKMPGVDILAYRKWNATVTVEARVNATPTVTIRLSADLRARNFTEASSLLEAPATALGRELAAWSGKAPPEITYEGGGKFHCGEA